MYYSDLKNKKGLNSYDKNKYLSLPLSEQMSIIFNNISKRVIDSENLYQKKEFEKASNKVKENINYCAHLCEFLIDFYCNNNEPHFAQAWSDYFIDLMSDIVLLSSSHNPIKKEEILMKIKKSVEMWQELGKQVIEENRIPIPTNNESLMFDA